MTQRLDQYRSLCRARLRQSADLRLALVDGCIESIITFAVQIRGCLQRGGKVVIFGNGGSAADAQHIAAEFVGRFHRERMALAAVALTTDTSILTAISNDYGFDLVFARQIEALGRPEDVALAISTSGRSRNVIEGITAAKRRGLITLALTGGDGGVAAKVADYCIVVPSDNTAQVQECHITIVHLICEFLDDIALSAELPQLSVRDPFSKITNWDLLLEFRENWRKQGKIVVWTNGCFDLLHAGHVFGLFSAKKFGAILVVGVNSDSSVRKLKGENRPIVAGDSRMLVVAGLESVDYVVPLEESTPESAIARLKPDIHCKGSEYQPPNGKPIPEATAVESYGGRIEFVPMLPGSSTSDLIRKVTDCGTVTGSR
jgi:phosphoheptose isomerase